MSPYKLLAPCKDDKTLELYVDGYIFSYYKLRVEKDHCNV